MTRSGHTLTTSFSLLKDFPGSKFLVTEIGCGLAGYEPKDIAPLFTGAIAVENIHMPEKFWNLLQVVIGFKGFNKDMKCQAGQPYEMQYTVGQMHEMPEGKKLAVCPSSTEEGGLHFCENPMDIFGYYPPANETELFQVRNRRRTR